MERYSSPVYSAHGNRLCTAYKRSAGTVDAPSFREKLAVGFSASARSYKEQFSWWNREIGRTNLELATIPVRL